MSDDDETKWLLPTQIPFDELKVRADVFTEEAMTRPLFEELTGDHAREDEWSGPHGFAIGGMMQANTASLAEEYFAAANGLVDGIKEKRIADYRVGNTRAPLSRFERGAPPCPCCAP